MKLIGTQTAEHGPPGRSRSLGQALSASLDSKTTGLPRRTATHENGDSTGHEGAPAVGLTATCSRCARLESETSSSIGVTGDTSSIARLTTPYVAASSSAISSASTSCEPKLSRWACNVSSCSSLTRSVVSRAFKTTPRT